MDEISEIVTSIVRGCSHGGVEVPDVLAAFVARTVLESNGSVFALDKALSPEKIEEVILQSIERLLERDSPSLETMKMQVAFDSAYLADDNEAQKTLRVRNKMVTAHKNSIVEAVMKDANDFESLTLLYRRIFRFLLDFAPNAKSHDRLVEREVAAALESVFPRIGLKAFIQLPHEEKSDQLMELARIVLGIRLFNRDQGRGGAGLDQMDADSARLSAAMVQDIDREVEAFSDACSKYQISLQRAHLLLRRAELEKNHAAAAKEQADDKLTGKAKPFVLEPLDFEPPKVAPTQYLIDRWSQELTNRRQYLCFLRTLQEDIRSSHTKITQIVNTLKMESANVQSLVSNKSSVAKEVVYPRFDTLGTLWIALYEEVTHLAARSNTFRVLCNYRLSFAPTLAESYYNVAPLSNANVGGDAVADSENNNVDNADKFDEDGTIIVGDSLAGWGEHDGAKRAEMGDSLPPSRTVSRSGAESKDHRAKEDGAKGSFENKGGDVGVGSGEVVSEFGAQLLSVHNTPDFMLLPLELQGFCPWTIVESNGLLIPGKPGLGVVRYDNMYFVFDHESGLKDFLRDPESILSRVKIRAMTSPEYINLLRLHRWFPKATISRLLEQNDFDVRSVGGKPLTRDASTSTPTHFVESFIDINYHWNEWELRRRALQVVNLKNKLTTGQQTDRSHFRREAEQQVYELRESGTQTKRDRGTNPPITTTFIAGLRGKPRDAKETVSKYSKETSDEDSKEERQQRGNANDKTSSSSVAEPKARVVTLVLDL